MASNPLRKDPTRTTMLRRRFEADVRRRFRFIRSLIWRSIVTEDVLGLRQTTGPIKLDLTTNAPSFAFATDAGKVKGYQRWFKEQVDAGVLETPPGTDPVKPWTADYVQSAYKKGATDAYISAKGAALQAESAFYQGTKAQFLSTAFGGSIGTKQLELLATRSFEQLKGITGVMSQRIGVTLTDGLAHGHGPRQIARAMVKEVDTITKKRALVMARTEIIHSYAEGQLDSLEQLGVETVTAMVEWSTAQDDRVCPTCQPLEGVIMTLKEARGIIPRHPSCRCAWIPVVDKPSKGREGTLKASVLKSVKAERKKKRTGKQAREQSTWAGKELGLKKGAAAKKKTGGGPGPARTTPKAPRKTPVRRGPTKAEAEAAKRAREEDAVLKAMTKIQEESYSDWLTVTAINESLSGFSEATTKKVVARLIRGKKLERLTDQHVRMTEAIPTLRDTYLRNVHVDEIESFDDMTRIVGGWQKPEIFRRGSGWSDSESVVAEELFEEVLKHKTKGQAAKAFKTAGMAEYEDMYEVVMDGVTIRFGEETRRSAASLGRLPLDRNFNTRTRGWRAQKQITFTAQKNADDAYWVQKYGEENFSEAAATGGQGNTVVFGKRGLSKDTYHHESGHNIASDEWGRATPPSDSMYGKAQRLEPPVSAYGATDPAEDFAEAVAMYMDDGQRRVLRRDFPRKYAAMKVIIEEGGDYGRATVGSAVSRAPSPARVRKTQKRAAAKKKVSKRKKKVKEPGTDTLASAKRAAGQLWKVINAGPTYVEALALEAGVSAKVAKAAMMAAMVGDYALPGVPAGSLLAVALTSLRDPAANVRVIRRLIKQLRKGMVGNVEIDKVLNDREVVELARFAGNSGQPILFVITYRLARDDGATHADAIAVAGKVVAGGKVDLKEDLTNGKG